MRRQEGARSLLRTALARISSLEFKLDHAAWDEKRRELNVVYEAYGMRWDNSGKNGHYAPIRWSNRS